jgi:NADH dehydrogenase
MSSNTEINVVTGAFSYTGRYIAKRLLSMGEKVRTLTNHPSLDFEKQIETFSLNFDNSQQLVNSLKGATTLYNTYWIRFEHGDVTFEKAIKNSKILINAAVTAGIERIVHISITNPDVNSPFPYFRGKAIVEKHIKNSGLNYLIIRPTVIFGGDLSTLINNIAWILRRFPIFAIPGSGDYKLQPIYIEDLVDLALNPDFKTNNLIIDAIGPEIFTYNDLVRTIASKIGRNVGFFHTKPEIALIFSNIISYFVKDVLVTKDEIYGLMSNLLTSNNPPTGKYPLTKWLSENAKSIGKSYISEVKRHYR